MFDGIYQLLGLDLFNATNMAEFFPFFFRFLVALVLLITTIKLLFGMTRAFTRVGGM